MKVTLTSTEKIVTLNGVPARVWEGETDTGIQCHAFVTRIAVDRNDEEGCAQFAAELQENRPPRPELAVYPLRMIL